MKRAEIQQELETVRKWDGSNYSSAEKNRNEAEAAERRLLNWYDEISRELEYVGSLRSNLKTVVAENVELGIENQQLSQKLDHAERALRNAIREEDEDE